MTDNIAVPLTFTDAAANKVKNLKGKVKSMVKTEYGYENSGKIKFTSLVKTEFNEKGYTTRESFTRDGVEYLCRGKAREY